MKDGFLRSFTLLEVVVALFILALGVGFLLTQFSIAHRRVFDAEADWRSGHELINAAEYLLAVRPGEKFAGEFADPGFRVRRSWSLAELPEGYDNPASGMRLATLTLILTDAATGREIDRMTIDCPVEGVIADADEAL